MGGPVTFTFYSPFDYKLESIIYEFEEMSGVALTQDFLCDSYIDERCHETQGILVGFKALEDGSYGVYFTSTIEDRIYLVDK